MHLPPHVRVRGSSPLTRGKLEGAPGWQIIHGLIPAHAGKTPPWMRRARASRAHPRSRGENRDGAAPGLVGWGSSPLTRGKHWPTRTAIYTGGLIPAHAGKTHQTRDTRPKYRAHPRSRGENIKAAVSVVVEWGSSPLTRGKLIPRAGIPGVAGLIPAHAGKTSRRFGKCPWRTAHPRSRGENRDAERCAGRLEGSSPLTRGKLVAPRADLLRERLIPAHAGKTASRRRRRKSTGAHPRSRGENSGRHSIPIVRAGSSPLTRGKPLVRVRPTTCPRLIPAHAGKTRRWRPATRPTRAHPRSRGENATLARKSS